MAHRHEPARRRWASRHCLLSCAAALVFSGCTSFIVGYDTPPLGASAWEQAWLGSVESADEAAYLGVARGEPFSVQAFEGRILIVEVVSRSCACCQAMSGRVTRLFELIQDHPDRDRIRMLAIMTNGTDADAARYRRRFDVMFPLIPDPSGQAMHALDVGRVPTFRVVDLTRGRPHEVISMIGNFGEPEAFLERITAILNGK